jgi:hypothetical protein
MSNQTEGLFAIIPRWWSCSAPCSIPSVRHSRPSAGLALVWPAKLTGTRTLRDDYKLFGCAILVGLLMIGQWTFFLSTQSPRTEDRAGARAVSHCR